MRTEFRGDIIDAIQAAQVEQLPDTVQVNYSKLKEGISALITAERERCARIVESIQPFNRADAVDKIREGR